MAAAEHALVEFEIAVETFRVEVDNFARLHHQRLGPVYARLDELDLPNGGRGRNRRRASSKAAPKGAGPDEGCE